MFLQQRHAERVVPAPEAVEQIKRFEMELHAPVLHLPEIKYLVDQAKQDMHILFFISSRSWRGCPSRVRLARSCSMGSAISVSGVRKSCEIFVKNTSLACVASSSSWESCSNCDFCTSNSSFCCINWVFCSSSFFFLHGQFTVQPVLGTQGEVDSHQQTDQQQ